MQLYIWTQLEEIPNYADFTLIYNHNFQVVI